MALEDRRLLSTFTVTSTLDDGSVGTPRRSVGDANSAGGAEPGVPGRWGVTASISGLTVTGGEPIDLLC
jgi:hypothetical protein